MRINKCEKKDFDNGDCTCEQCDTESNTLWHLYWDHRNQPHASDYSEVFLCTGCIKELRSKIGALSILTMTGENTQ